MNKVYSIIILIFFFFSHNLRGQVNSSSLDSKILIHTSLGEITLRLYKDTPLHRSNFINLVKEQYFDNQIFHRVIKDFMIQGGDPNSRNADKGVLLGQGGPGYSIPAEINPKYYHKKGALAAARKGDSVNPEKSSSGSQFYIIQGTIFTESQLNNMVKQGTHAPFTPQQVKDYCTIGGSPHLDGSYTVFGEIVSGFDVLDKIANSDVDAYDRPINDIKYTIKIIN